MSATVSLQYPRVVNYQNIRHQLQTGDVIAFGGAYLESRMIKKASGGVVSHIGIVLRSRFDAQINDTVVEVMEANHDEQYPDLNGVVLSRLTDRIPFYKGDIWILRLADAYRSSIDIREMEKFLVGELGKEYDMKTRWRAAIDWFDRWGVSHNPENLQSYFCSELIAAAYKYCGAMPDINPSEINPTDIIRWQIYQPDYYQIKCWEYKAVAIPEYNSLSVCDL